MVLVMLMTFSMPALQQNLTSSMSAKFLTISASMVSASTLPGVSLPSLKFSIFGMRVSSKGCVSLQKHSEVISAFVCPVDKKGLQRFLGILNFNRRFIKGAVGLLALLTKALKGKVSTLSRTLDRNQAFSATKSSLMFQPLCIQILQQVVAGSWARWLSTL